MSHSTPASSNRNLISDAVDGLVFGAAFALPWSTSAASVFIVLAILLLPFSTGVRPVISKLRSAAGGTPVAFVAFAAAGIAWSTASWAENLGAWDSYGKLLLVPLLLVQYQSSPYGARILAGFLISCGVLLLFAWVVTLWSWHDMPTARLELIAPVKNPATQIREFLLAGVALLLLAVTTRPRHIFWMVVLYFGAMAFLVSALCMASVTHALETLTTLFVLVAASWLALPAIAVSRHRHGRPRDWHRWHGLSRRRPVSASRSSTGALFQARHPSTRLGAVAVGNFGNRPPVSSSKHRCSDTAPGQLRTCIEPPGDRHAAEHHDQSSPANPRGRYSARRMRDAAAVGHVARTSAPLSSSSSVGVGRSPGGRTDDRGLAAQFSVIRFHRGLALRHCRRRRRRSMAPPAVPPPPLALPSS